MPVVVMAGIVKVKGVVALLCAGFASVGVLWKRKPLPHIAMWRISRVWSFGTGG